MEKLREFRALLLSPYLQRDFRYGPLKTDKGREVRTIVEKGSLDCNFFFDEDIRTLPSMGELIIIGSTPGSEEAVKRIRNMGTLIARYSKFYGGRSEYSGRTAAEGGYSFDMPKETGYVKALLESDCILEAIFKRDPKKIMEALTVLNKRLNKPILATPFLEVALR